MKLQKLRAGLFVVGVLLLVSCKLLDSGSSSDDDSNDTGGDNQPTVEESIAISSLSLSPSTIDISKNAATIAVSGKIETDSSLKSIDVSVKDSDSKTVTSIFGISKKALPQDKNSWDLKADADLIITVNACARLCFIFF